MKGLPSFRPGRTAAVFFRAIDKPGHATRLVATQQLDKALQELTEYCPVRGTASLRPAHRLGAIFFILFLHVHRGEHLVEVGGHTCIPATVTISAVLAGG